MSKYKPLSDRLAGHPHPEWRASFAEIEEVLGFPLPKAARTSGPWWSDARRHWREHGWEADEIDHSGGYVTFRRNGRITAAVAEDVMSPEPQHGAGGPPLPPDEAAMNATPEATSDPMRRPRATAPIVAGVAVAAGVVALVARTLLRRRSGPGEES